MKKMIFVVCLTLAMGLGLANTVFSADSVVQEITIVSDNSWRSFNSQQSGWEMKDFNDSGWNTACAPYPYSSSYPPTSKIPGTHASYMWDYKNCSAADGQNGNMYAWFRKTFHIPPASIIVKATVTAAADDNFIFYVNGHEVKRQMSGNAFNPPDTFDVTSYLVPGKNVFAMYAIDSVGAYEWALVDAKIRITVSSGRTIYVKNDATGANNGTSWTDAYTDLQAALAAAISGDDIWVAKGVYKPTSGTDRTISFNMKNGVKIYGGFAGNETSLSQRNWQTNKTVLSGDIDGNDAVDSAGITTTNNTQFNGANSCHVIYNGGGIDNTAVLDGFIVTGGQAGGRYGTPNFNGGGMLNENSNPTITNCSFLNNSALRGGGMNNNNSNPTIINCSFSHNWSLGGGGMSNVDSNPTITNCSFSDNVASLFSEGDGGGMLNDSSNPTITNCSFFSNSAYYGGGMSNWGSSSPIITNSSFSENSASYVSGMCNNGSGSPKIYNSIIESISSHPHYPNIPIRGEVYYSIIRGGWSGAGSNNKSLDPLFVNAAAGDFRLQSGSPAIDAGNNSYITGVITDLCGKPRITDGTVDMGAYESPYVDINDDGVIDMNDLNIIKANLNKSASACPKCDLDKDGKITVLDAKKLMNMCSCPNCVCP